MTVVYLRKWLSDPISATLVPLKAAACIRPQLNSKVVFSLYRGAYLSDAIDHAIDKERPAEFIARHIVERALAEVVAEVGVQLDANVIE